MDNPISALDPNIRLQIINNVFFGKLKNRTRILVTHAIDFLRRSDLIIMMEHGRIKAKGSFQEMLQFKDFTELIKLNNFNQKFLNSLVPQKTKSVAQPQDELTTVDSDRSKSSLKNNSVSK